MPRRTRALLSLALAAAASSLAVQSLAAQNAAPAPRDPPAVRRALEKITGPDFQARLDALAHDSTRGRQAPSVELDKAADWVARQFREAGLRPGGANGSFLQPFTMRSVALDSTTTMSATWAGGAAGWVFGTDFVPQGTTVPRATSAPVVLLVGLPADTARPFGDVPLRGAAVVQVVAMQQFGAQFAAIGQRISRYADSAGAVAHVLVSRFPAQQLTAIARMATAGRWTVDGLEAEGGRRIPIIALQQAAAAPMLAAAGMDSAVLAAAAYQPARLLDGVTLSITPRFSAERQATVANVVGVLPGRDRTLRGQVVMFTSHIDHTGTIPGNCRPSQELPADSICNGADDNASGTIGVIEMARAFAALNPRPARTIVFAAVTAEERGLFGARWYAAHPLQPLDSVRALFNFDMIARHPADSVGIVGMDSSALGPLVRSTLERHPELKLTIRPYGGALWTMSDHFPFAQRGVPAIFFFSGIHHDLHTAADNPDRARSDQAAAILRLAFLSAFEVANGITALKLN